jgi:hypothetical protein
MNERLKPCKSPYCECDVGKCTHPGFYDCRGIEMNERIQELADQAQQYAEYNTPQGLEWLPMFKERFAELIVLECADIATYHFRRTFEDGAKAIKEHFGVEE